MMRGYTCGNRCLECLKVGEEVAYVAPGKLPDRLLNTCVAICGTGNFAPSQVPTFLSRPKRQQSCYFGQRVE